MTRRKRQLLNTVEDARDDHELDNIARFEPRRETVGDLLRRTREIKGQNLDDVAARLRIRPAYLKAIESGRFQDLPGSTYAVGFVRTYADHLGLDSDDVVRRFRDEVAEVNSQTQLVFPVVAAEGKIPRGAILLLSALLGAIAYGGWYYLSEREQSPLDLIPELPAQLRALVSDGEGLPETAQLPAQPPVDAGDPGQAAEPAATGSAPEQPVAAAVPPAGNDASALPPSTLGDVDDVALSAATASALPGTPAPAAAPPPVDADALEAARLSAITEGQPTAVQPADSGATSPSEPAAPALPADVAPPPAASLASSDLPAVAAPTLDSSGLPAVAAPATGGAPGAQIAAAEGATLPPIAEGEVLGAIDGPSRIVLVARLESWVQVVDPEKKELLNRVLRAGDRYYVPDSPGLTLATGNAGGLDIWVDGRKLPALGPVGVVRRGIALDPQRLQDGTAAQATPGLE